MITPAPAAIDAFGRRFRYLRLSVTEICNFRCTYCLPNGYVKSGTRAFLSPAEAGRLIAAFSELGLIKVRLTGGEPSVRKDLIEIIERAASQPQITKVAMTTNGWNLARKIDDWSAAGLTHLNVSVDALRREAFAAITPSRPYLAPPSKGSGMHDRANRSITTTASFRIATEKTKDNTTTREPP